MKQLLVFQNGTRHIGDSSAMILSQHPSNIITTYSLNRATKEELDSLATNPFQDELLKTIVNRAKIKV